jgi:alanine racemase
MSDNSGGWARIDLDAISANVGQLRDRTSAGVMAVVKADGYGHGMVPSALAALRGGASWLGVALPEEALHLREAGITAPVLSWLWTTGGPWAKAIAAHVDVSASAPWAVAEIADAARQVGRSARVHLKVDTGLGRSGSTPAEWRALVEAALKASADGLVEVVAVWSHLACADDPEHPSVAAQLAAFDQALAEARAAGLTPPLRHIANSPATLLLPQAHYDLVRCGIASYGVSPAPLAGDASSFGLRPAMSLAARVALVKRVRSGHGVSYGHTYSTAAETTLALLPLGYADGVPRHASNVGPLLLGGRRRRIAGTVAMDQFVVDVGDDPIDVGDEALLFGPGDAGEPTAQDWAHAVGTIGYEIVTRVGARVPRRYVGDSRLLAEVAAAGGGG